MTTKRYIWSNLHIMKSRSAHDMSSNLRNPYMVSNKPEESGTIRYDVPLLKLDLRDPPLILLFSMFKLGQMWLCWQYTLTIRRLQGALRNWLMNLKAGLIKNSR